MLAAGEWVAQQPGGRIASFGDLSALYSPWVKWATLAEEWCKAQDDKDRRGLQEFVNLRLGQPWVEHQQTIAVEYLERRREYYGPTLPAGIVLLTAGVDVQDNRLEAEILGWGPGKESWGIQYLRLMGDPTQPSVWQLLDSHLTATWPTADGRRLLVACAAVDSGGHCTSEVYDFCRAREARRVFAIKGQGGQGTAIIAKTSRNNRQRAALFHLGVDSLKSLVFSRLLLDHEGPGYCHFPREADRNFDSGYFHGLLSEKRLVSQKAGVTKVEWRKTAERNEPLDCRAYATAALEILSPNLETLAAAGRGDVTRPAASRPGRRVLSRGIS